MQKHLPLGGSKQLADNPQKIFSLWRNVWAEQNSVRFRPQDRRRLLKKSSEEERAAMHAKGLSLSTLGVAHVFTALTSLRAVCISSTRYTYSLLRKARCSWGSANISLRCILSRTILTTACYKKKKTLNKTICRKTDKHNFLCSNPDLVLEGKMSPRGNKRVHQLDPHLVPAKVLLPALAVRPKQLLVLVWDLVHHVAHLLAEVQYRLQKKNAHALGQKVSLISVSGWVFTFSALQGPGGNGDLGVINCATLRTIGNLFLGHSLHTQFGSVL